MNILTAIVIGLAIICVTLIVLAYIGMKQGEKERIDELEKTINEIDYDLDIVKRRLK